MYASMYVSLSLSLSVLNEAIVSKFKLLYRHLHEGAEETHEYCRLSWPVLAPALNLGPPSYEAAFPTAGPPPTFFSCK
jgi:hypothetical protein